MPSSVRLRSLGIQVCGRQHMFRKSSQAMVMVNMKTEKTIIEFGLGMAGYPLQYSCLENSMDCITHGVTKSWTRLRDFHFTFKTYDLSPD